MRISVNLDEVQELQPLPAGWYPVTITSAEAKTSDDGKDYIQWEATVSEGEYVNRKLYFRTYLQPNALWNLKNLLKAAGVEWDPQGFSTEDALGATLEVQVALREYEDPTTGDTRITNNVRKYRPI